MSQADTRPLSGNQEVAKGKSQPVLASNGAALAGLHRLWGGSGVTQQSGGGLVLSHRCRAAGAALVRGERRNPAAGLAVKEGSTGVSPVAYSKSRQDAGAPLSPRPCHRRPLGIRGPRRRDPAPVCCSRLADREGFEPSERFHVHTLSRRARSTPPASVLLRARFPRCLR